MVIYKVRAELHWERKGREGALCNLHPNHKIQGSLEPCLVEFLPYFDHCFSLFKSFRNTKQKSPEHLTYLNYTYINISSMKKFFDSSSWWFVATFALHFHELSQSFAEFHFSPSTWCSRWWGHMSDSYTIASWFHFTKKKFTPRWPWHSRNCKMDIG